MAEKNNTTTKHTDVDKPSLLKRVKAFFKNETMHFVLGLVMVIFAVYLLLAFMSFFVTGAADQSILEVNGSGQLSITDNGVQNYAGSRGAQLAHYLINDCFGLASFFILFFMTLAGLKLMRVRQCNLTKAFVICSLLLVWTSIFLGYAFSVVSPVTSHFAWGGLHGYNVSRWLESQIGHPGVLMLLLVTAICFMIYLSTQTIIYLRNLFSLKFLRRKAKEAEEESQVDPFADIKDQPESQPEIEEVVSPEIVLDLDGDINKKLEEVEETNDGVNLVIENNDEEAPVVADEDENGETDNEPTFEVETKANEAPIQLEPYNPRLDLEHYRFPTLDLMKHFDDSSPTIDMEEQNANKEKIVNTLRSFGIEISTIKATVGPTVTLYEITLEQGIRISKIKGLEDDIALSLAALGIRIIAPIPGKGTIGIEVPNINPKIVSGQSIIGSKKFQESTAELPIVLGKTITNEVFMVDLAKMPHVLVAGATGQGKSVGLNAIITSLLYKKHPAELKLVLIDPKKVEFSIYSAIENHFLAKLPDEGDAIITDVTKVVQTLSSICVEMDTRYDLLKIAQVRNVKEYNEKFMARKLNPEKGHKYMPYIVVVIDEFGDLIMTAGRDVELPIARIAQLARAVGIHMIIATQRPTTNIITGTIKANFPARVAFRVSSMIDSRTILDRPGANQLVGKGDLLFLQGADPVRVQCAFIDTPEVDNICKYIAKQQGYTSAFHLPEYIDPNAGESEVGDVDMTKLDPLFDEAAQLIVSNQQGSTSLIQRKFAIGYNRAGRLMDQLEAAGIVGPAQGSKPREVYCVDLTDLEMRLNNIHS